MIQQIAVLGDITNYGGRIITASGNGYCGIVVLMVSPYWVI